MDNAHRHKKQFGIFVCMREYKRIVQFFSLFHLFLFGSCFFLSFYTSVQFVMYQKTFLVIQLEV